MSAVILFFSVFFYILAINFRLLYQYKKGKVTMAEIIKKVYIIINFFEKLLDFNNIQQSILLSNKFNCT